RCGPRGCGSYVALAAVLLPRLRLAARRGSPAAAATGLDQDQVALAERRRRLAPEVPRVRAGIDRDAERQRVLSPGHAPRGHHAAVEHAGQRHLWRQHAIGAAEAQAAAVRAVTRRAGAQAVLLDAERVLGLDDLRRRVH